MSGIKFLLDTNIVIGLLKEFVESLTQAQFVNVQKFFETIPTLKKQVHFKCNKCGYTEEINIEGLQSFFM